MLELKNVSKYYYNKGLISSGFSKVNLKLDMGEFVAITGESGSGKSTLLNVLSGLDSYEDGEMYIDGKETSHYTEKDFEEYRRRYVGNIFQDFNLVLSYTVYQNIELVLLLNGCKKKNIKDSILELINRVGLYKFRNTKVAKLSGGQKQRVAIARALAKNTPIIIADEPTGNLDSESASEVIKLLSEVCKDKLVIIVTHNYSQVEPYVTRKITMSDGKIIEDKTIRKITNIPVNKELNYHDITFLNQIRLSIRNTFNIIPKFLLLLFVYLFIVVALISEYAYFKASDASSNSIGYSQYFHDTSSNRIIISKNDRSSITEEDYNKISKLNNIDHIVKNDLLLDYFVSITDENNIYFNGSVDVISNIKKVDKGSITNLDNGVVVEIYKDNYQVEQVNKLLNQELTMIAFDTHSKVKITGIKYIKDTNNMEDIYNMKFYVAPSVLEKLVFQVNQSYSTNKVLFMNKVYTSDSSNNAFKIIPSSVVPSGEVYISGSYDSNCPKENCYKQILNISTNNLYYDNSLNLTITKSYDKKSYKTIFGSDEFDKNDGAIFISNSDYESIYNKGIFQSSVFVKNDLKINKTIKELNKLGYNTLQVSKTLGNDDGTQIIKVVGTCVTIILIITLFFITYFVIRLIMKSRNSYFAILRILGCSKKIARNLLILEMFIVSNIAYFGFMLYLYYAYLSKTKIAFITTILKYLNSGDYLILYIIIGVMSYLISIRYAKKLFSSSAMKTMRERS
jgi:putative ABC transport system permease protein